MVVRVEDGDVRRDESSRSCAGGRTGGGDSGALSGSRENWVCTGNSNQRNATQIESNPIRRVELHLVCNANSNQAARRLNIDLFASLIPISWLVWQLSPRHPAAAEETISSQARHLVSRIKVLLRPRPPASSLREGAPRFYDGSRQRQQRTRSRTPLTLPKPSTLRGTPRPLPPPIYPDRCLPPHRRTIPGLRMAGQDHLRSSRQLPISPLPVAQ